MMLCSNKHEIKYDTRCFKGRVSHDALYTNKVSVVCVIFLSFSVSILAFIFEAIDAFFMGWSK